MILQIKALSRKIAIEIQARKSTGTQMNYVFVAGLAFSFKTTSGTRVSSKVLTYVRVGMSYKDAYINVVREIRTDANVTVGDLFKEGKAEFALISLISFEHAKMKQIEKTTFDIIFD